MEPSLTPSVVERLAEAAAAQTTAQELPTSHDGRERRPGQSLEDWLANVTYWRLYGSACPTTLPAQGADACRAAWVRLRALVVLALAQKPQPAPAAGSWVWPVKRTPRSWRGGGKFGAKRPWKGPQTRYHCGIDLDAALGDQVLAPEAGVVLSGSHGWEAPVKAVVLAADSGRTILLGGIAGSTGAKAGTRVKAGEAVGLVGAYPKGDTMVHVQVFSRPLTLAQVYARQSWRLGEPQPDALIDPAALLREAAKGLLAAAEGPDENGETSEGTLEVGLSGLLRTFLGVE